MLATNLAQDLVALVGLPVAVFATCLGVGLLAERVTGVRLPQGLVVPAGFCVAILLVMPAYKLGLGAWVGAGVLLASAVAGVLVTPRGELRGRIDPGWVGLAGLAVYAVYVAPMALSGLGWTWTGYNFVNDTSVQFLLTEHLKSAGTHFGSIPPSTEAETIREYLRSGYPLGTHAYLASISQVLLVPVEVVYQAFLSAMAGMAAMAFATLARRSGFSARGGAIAAAVAVCANLTYNYALQGNIKEIGILATLAVSAALARELLSSERPLGAVALVGAGLAATLSVYSAAGAPYVAAFAAALYVAVFVQRDAPVRRVLVPAAAVGALVAVVPAIPALTTIVQFYRVASSTVSGTSAVASALGQLQRPLELSQTTGIWLSGNYTLPVPGGLAALLTSLAAAVVAALLSLGIVTCIRRRETGPLLALVPPALTLALVAPRVAPYAEGKMLAIVGPSVVLAAAYGLLELRRIAQPLALGLGCALVVAILWSDAYAFHDTKLAPTGRMEAIRDVGERFAGQGPILFNEFEEFAKYFAKDARLNVAFEALTPRQVELRKPVDFFGRYFDLDQERLEYIEAFPIVAMRRSPAASRPPANYARVYANAYYEVWRRRAAPRVIDHLSLQELHSAAIPARCRDVRALARRARRTGGRLVAAQRPQVVSFETANAVDRSPGWASHPYIGGTVLAHTPGYARGRVRVKAGRYTAWVRGDFPRELQVFVDGRRVGAVQGINTPGQWLRAGTLALGAGTHRVELRRPGGRLAPGDGGATVIGPLALERDAPARLREVPTSRWRSLCGRTLDWIEVVEP